ncbi:GNAT family N-acetyltransferase [Methylobacterium marchantiae]|uniref:GNAT family N-acetyltransferase n=1 Tax=Methylobacterium marchantiae TaxID=600331 RepID=A0ABW3X0K6_9HYPH|nr:Mycothiol acetyltransferase [Methylobacterium marchantiae]
MTAPLLVRPAEPGDADAVWSILEPVIRAGETYVLPRDGTRDSMLAYWFAPGNQVFVAVDEGRVLGTSMLKANQQGGGAHVANAGFMTHPAAAGRGVARAMGRHALETAARQGFRAMQFNFVVASNTRAVALWKSLGFRELARLPEAFRHPTLGLVDALVMHRTLDVVAPR